jgi:hypothetical protein
MPDTGETANLSASVFDFEQTGARPPLAAADPSLKRAGVVKWQRDASCMS